MSTFIKTLIYNLFNVKKFGTLIPNFFISARLNKELSYKEDIEIADKKQTYFSNKQFENRLFDRDTLLICHYDVNFLYVVSLYARNNAIQKDNWKAKVREMFRTEIQRILSEKFEFYAMTAHPDVDAEIYIIQRLMLKRRTNAVDVI